LTAGSAVSWKSRRRGRLAVAAAVALAVGCGDDPEIRVATGDPARAFAPLVLLDPSERLMPAGARWFVDRSVLRFAEDQGCEHLTVAVGRRLPAQRTAAVDWIYVTGLGAGPAYWRTTSGPDCDSDPEDRVEANELTRPHHPRGRAEGMRAGEGFYLDLVDRARRGVDRRALGRVPAYFQARPRAVDGEPGIALVYWMLFGASAGPDGELAHEGDWESVEVLLKGGDGEYEPVSARLPGAPAQRAREIPWSALELAGPGAEPATHPVLAARRGDHALGVARGRCRGCPRWRTWGSLARAADQLWHGFGGAWGEVGETAGDTGPLGPVRVSRR
jgi:hypothetical protein